MILHIYLYMEKMNEHSYVYYVNSSRFDAFNFNFNFLISMLLIITSIIFTSNARLCDSLNPRLNISLHRWLFFAADVLKKVASGICTWFCDGVNINVHIFVGVYSAIGIVVILLAIQFVHLICYSISNTQKKSMWLTLTQQYPQTRKKK